MNADEAKDIVKKMHDDVAQKAPSGLGRDSYILGGLLVKIEFMLTTSNLKYKDFNDKGYLKLPGEK